MTKKDISLFTPSRSDPEALEAILVQRHEILNDAVERVRESASTGNKHHLLFVGPRGTGKTYLVTLLVHRLDQDTDLGNKLCIAWLNEDETSTTLLDLLRRIYLALNKRHSVEFDKESLDAIYDLKPEEAEQYITQLLLERLKKRTLLVIVENLDALFEGLKKSGQQDLRAFIQEHPVLSIIATAQKLTDDISKRKSTFFGFFQTEHLKTLSIDEAAELLGKIAVLNKQSDLALFLRSATGRSRIRALYHLSGGNHRIYIALSKFITHDSINTLVELFSRMIDKMTPYYQERIRWLTPQQRKIIEHLCASERPATVKKIARHLFTSHQSVSSQLKELREKGYVQAAQRGRESLYEIAEPLMRICVEVKENQSNEPLRMLVDFLRIWYDVQELSTRLKGCNSVGVEQVYLKSAVERNSVHGNLRAQLLVEGFRAELGGNQDPQWNSRLEAYADESEELALAFGMWAKGKDDQALLILKEITNEKSAHSDRTKGSAWMLAGEIYYQNDEFELAIKSLDSVLKLPNTSIGRVINSLQNRALTYRQLGNLEEAVADYSAVIELTDAPVEQVIHALLNRGIIHAGLGDSEKAIADYNIIVELADAPIVQVVQALLNRGFTYGSLGNSEKAIADYSTVINMAEVPVGDIAAALINRGVAYGDLGDMEKEVADYSVIVDLADASIEDVSKALFNRGVAYGNLGDIEKAITDYSAIVELAGAPIEDIATALINRGVKYGKLGKTEKEIADYCAIIELKDAPMEQVTQAFINRGVVYGELGKTEKEIADYSAIIELTDAPIGYVATALINRGLTYGQLGNSKKAIADYSAIINLTDIPIEQVATAFFIRGGTYWKLKDSQKSEKDLESVLRLEDAPISLRVGAHFNLAEIHISNGRWSAAISILSGGLRERGSHDSNYLGDSRDVIGAFFESTLTPKIRQERIHELAQVYRDNNAITQLGEVLVKHLGMLYVSEEGLPASDNLEFWASAWEDAFNGVDAFRLPLRIFRTGIDFLKSGGKDRGILLDLNQEERKILEQAMELNGEL